MATRAPAAIAGRPGSPRGHWPRRRPTTLAGRPTMRTASWRGCAPQARPMSRGGSQRMGAVRRAGPAGRRPWDACPSGNRRAPDRQAPCRGRGRSSPPMIRPRTRIWLRRQPADATRRPRMRVAQWSSIPSVSRRMRKYSGRGRSSVMSGPSPTYAATAAASGSQVCSSMTSIHASIVVAGESYAVEMSSRTPGRSRISRMAAGLQRDRLRRSEHVDAVSSRAADDHHVRVDHGERPQVLLELGFR